MKVELVCDCLLPKMTSKKTRKRSKSFRLFASIDSKCLWFSSEQAAYFVPVEIANGHCIASYVAWAKESVRIDNIASVKTINKPWRSFSFSFSLIPTNIQMDFTSKMIMLQQLWHIRSSIPMEHYSVEKSLFEQSLIEHLSLGVIEFYRIDSAIPFTDEDEEVSRYWKICYRCLLTFLDYLSSINLPFLIIVFARLLFIYSSRIMKSWERFSCKILRSYFPYSRWIYSI